MVEGGCEKQTVNVDDPSATGIRSETLEEPGRSKHKRVPQRLADALNGCLCGLVLNRSLNGVLECKHAGCETQWVSTLS
jgi:hypothetical protein